MEVCGCALGHLSTVRLAMGSAQSRFQMDSPFLRGREMRIGAVIDIPTRLAESNSCLRDQVVSTNISSSRTGLDSMLETVATRFEMDTTERFSVQGLLRGTLSPLFLNS